MREDAMPNERTSENGASGQPGYPPAMRILHWLVALLVLSQLAVGMAMSGPDDALLEGLFSWHVSLGVLIGLLALVRVGNRLRSVPPPIPATFPAWERAAARLAHLALYVLLVAVPVLGYLAAGAMPDADGVHALGMRLPALIAPDAGLAEALGEWHETGVWTLTGVLLIHVGAVIRHAFFDRPEHDVLRRML